MKRLIIALAVSLGGCATVVGVGYLQTECESKTKTFPEMANCLKLSIETHPRCGRLPATATPTSKTCFNSSPNDSSVKLYLLKAEQLSQGVQKKEISDLDARVELQKLYVEWNHRIEMENAASSAASAARDAASAAKRSRTTTCTDSGLLGVTCTTD